jgi:hypothetical protein
MTHAEFADGLRQIASFFEKHEELPLPDGMSGNWFSFYDWGSNGKELIVNAARAFGTCDKETGGQTCYGVRKDFGAFTVRFLSAKEQVCTKKVIGTRHVEEYFEPGRVISAHDEEIVEWECPESLLFPPAIAVLGEANEETIDSIDPNKVFEQAPVTTADSPNLERPDVDSGTNQGNG